jgi:hypothetical protein
LGNDISEVTRRNIFDFLSTSGLNWWGRLDEVGFLSRLYDLTEMPSTDRRVKNAAGDIHQHCVEWNDWPPNWIFTDSRFNLLRGDDMPLLKFLCETINPVVRTDEHDVLIMLAEYNTALAVDGWKLVEEKKLSGRSVFAPQKIGAQVTVFEEPTGWQKVDRQLQEARSQLNTADSEEKFQTVGLVCREALITVSQEVFDPAKHPILDGTDVSDTDAKRKLEAVFSAELAGGANEEARSHAKMALKLAIALQHKRTADFRMAAICMEATVSVVNLLAILAGRRGR